MYPNLYFLIKKTIGIEPPVLTSVVQTYGLFLAITFVVAGFLIYHELKRKYEEGLLNDALVRVNPYYDGVVNLFVGFLFGYKLLYISQNYDAFLANPQEIVLSTKGAIWGGLLGALLFGGFKFWEIYSKKLKTTEYTRKPHELIGDMVVVAAVFGILGSKILALLETWDEFLQNPVEMLLSGSGIAIYGGLLGGFLSVYFYAKRKKIAPLQLMDAAAPALLLGYGIGRMGCHLSGDGDWGIVNKNPKPFAALPDWLWSFNYPNNVLKEGLQMTDCFGKYYTDAYCYVLPEGVYPTSVYETLTMVVLFFLFWAVRKRIKIAGVLFFMYLIVNGLERFFIETIRVNDRYDWAFNLTQAQMISIGFLLTGIIGIIYLVAQHRKMVVRT